MAKDLREIRAEVAEDGFFSKIMESEDFPILILLRREEKDKVGHYVFVKIPDRHEERKSSSFSFKVNEARHEKITDPQSKYFGFWGCPKTWFKTLMGDMISNFGGVHLVKPYASGEECYDACGRAGKKKMESADYQGMSEKQKRIERDKLQFSPACDCPCMGEFHGEKAGIQSPYVFSERIRSHESEGESTVYSLVEKSELQ